MTNILKTFLLLSLLSVILIIIGGFVGGREGIIYAFIFSLVLNAGMYFFSDKLALSSSRAKPLSKSQNPEIYSIVSELSKKMDIPMPTLYLAPSLQANAFATGRSPRHASVAVTQGILNLLTTEEIKGVLAHELSHVKNRDILIASIAAVLASSISFVSNMAIFGGSDDDDRAGGLGILIALLIPIAASIIQFAISRQREFGADESGAKIMGDGKPLARALVAIQRSTSSLPVRTNPAFSSLYIENPLGGHQKSLLNLFSTHPPVEERVKRLQKI